MVRTRGDVDATGPQPLEVGPARLVVADRADHRSRSAPAAAAATAWLPPLPPANRCSGAVGEDGLARARVAFDRGDEVDVERAEHDDPAHQRIPPLTVSSHSVA